MIAVLLAVGVAVAISACGGSNANTLLQQTFSGAHSVRSGSLSFNLNVAPSGSTTLTGPISLNFGGPFQTKGSGKLPQSNFQLSFSGMGRSGSVGILSTGTSGYVSVQGTSYQLPAATFQRLESSFSQVGASGTSSSTNVLPKLGIHPLRWLVRPQVVGQQSIGGTDTTHIRANVDVSAFLSDFSTFMQKASATGVSGSSTLRNGIPPATQQQIASEVQSPTFDVWTGNSDKTLRRLELHLTIPVTGQVSTLLGGLRSATISLNMQYTDLNQPQTISAPSNVQPFAQFQSKLRAFVASIQSAGASAIGSGGSAGSSSGSAAAGTTGAGSTGNTGSAGASSSSSALQAYTACLQAAGQDVSKMQRCSSLLHGG